MKQKWSIWSDSTVELIKHTVQYMLLTLSEDPLQWHKAHQSCQKSASSCAGLKSEQPRSRHVPNRSSRVTSHPVYRDSTWHLQAWNLKRRQGKFRKGIAKHEAQYWTLNVLTYIEVGDTALALPRVAVRVRRRTWWWGWRGQLEAGNARRVPIGPEKAVGLDVQVHGIDAHIGVTLECLLINPLAHIKI